MAILLDLQEKFSDFNDKINFNVAEGFLVSTLAFEEHLETFLHIKNAIKELELIAHEISEVDIQKVCEKVQNSFLNSLLSQMMKIEIASKVRKIRENDKNSRFAVRSSGLTEDGEELSCAGQNQTFLGKIELI